MTKKDGTEIIPNKYRATSLDIAKICDAYDCAEGCGHRWAQCTNKEPIFAHRICDGWVDCEDESDEKGCEGTPYPFITFWLKCVATTLKSQVKRSSGYAF